MSDIAALYEEVMAGAAETEKVASDVNDDAGPEFGPEFFEKVAAGDEASVTVLNDFIENAKAEGHSEEEIESAILQVMEDAGVEGGEEAADGTYGGEAEEADEFEQQKAAAFMEGAEKAMTDALESDFAKEAGVSLDDLLEFELGGQYGEGYAQTRAVLDNAILKIAEAKELEKEAGRLGKLKGKLMEMVNPTAAQRVAKQTRGYRAGGGTVSMAERKKMLATAKKDTEKRKKLLKNVGKGALVTGGLGAAGGAGYMAGKD